MQSRIVATAQWQDGVVVASGTLSDVWRYLLR
jgi:hypothetical protein